MSLQQVYYTSCTRGLREGKGFQINAASEGMDPRVLDQVERLGVYLPPVSLPTRPSPQELEQFPVSLIFESLGNGEYLLAQAKYTGTDYSGRYGNYFTHSLVASGAEFEGIRPLPIDFWRSPVWSTSESPAPSLPALTLPPIAGGISPESLHRHLADPVRRDRLEAFLTAVEAGLTSRRRIILVDDNEAIAHWIALATICLPRNLALQVTFNTYVKSPYQSNALIVGVLSRRDTDFTFAAHEVSQQYYVFDFQYGEYSPVPGESPFASYWAQQYLEGRFELARDFQDFASQTFPKLAVQDLMLALAAFGIVENVPTPCQDMLQLLQWATPNASRLPVHGMKSLMAMAIERHALRPATDLMVAVARGMRLDGASRRDLIGAYVEWLITTWLASVRPIRIPLAELREAVEAACSVAAIVPPLDLADTWRLQAEHLRDPDRTPLLLKLGLSFGLMGESPEQWRRIGQEILGPLMVGGTIAEVLPAHAEAACMTEVVYGIGLFLCAQYNPASWMGAIRPLLATPSLRETLLQAAYDQRQMELYAYLFGVQSADRTSRLNRFQYLHADLRRMADDPTRAFMAAVAGIWDPDIPSLTEALALVKAFPEDLKRAGRMSWLCQSLYQDFSPWRVEPERYALAELLHQRYERELWDQAGIVNLVRIAGCGLNERLNPGLLEILTVVMDPRFPVAVRDAALAFVAAKILELPDEKHYQVLNKALDLPDNAFLRRYREAVTSVTPPEPAEFVASLFHIYWLLPKNKREKLLDTVLDDVWQQWPGSASKKRAAMAKVLQHARQDLARWNDWKGTGSSFSVPPIGVMLGGVVAFVAMIVVVNVVVNKLSPVTMQATVSGQASPTPAASAPPLGGKEASRSIGTVDPSPSTAASPLARTPGNKRRAKDSRMSPATHESLTGSPEAPPLVRPTPAEHPKGGEKQRGSREGHSWVPEWLPSLPWPIRR